MKSIKETEKTFEIASAGEKSHPTSFAFSRAAVSKRIPTFAGSGKDRQRDERDCIFCSTSFVYTLDEHLFISFLYSFIRRLKNRTVAFLCYRRTR